MSRSKRFKSFSASGTNGVNKANGTNGNTINRANGTNGHGTNGHILTPEIMDTMPQEQSLLTEAGRIPALRTRLRETLTGYAVRQESAVDDILKVTAAETEYLESVAKQKKQQYKDMLNFHEKQGV